MRRSSKGRLRSTLCTTREMPENGGELLSVEYVRTWAIIGTSVLGVKARTVLICISLSKM